MNYEIRYDTIQWSCDFDNSRINVTAYDLDNQADIAKQMTFKEVLGMITDDGNGNHIDIIQFVEKYDKEEENYWNDEDSFILCRDAFFEHIMGVSKEPRMTEDCKQEYNDKVTQAISDLLEGKKKLLSLNEI